MISSYRGQFALSQALRPITLKEYQILIKSQGTVGRRH